MDLTEGAALGAFPESDPKIASMIEAIASIFRVKELRNKILFILGILVVYRLAANIPVPGVDVVELKRFFSENALIGLLNIFFVCGLLNISVMLLGLGPYIMASIIM